VKNVSEKKKQMGGGEGDGSRKEQGQQRRGVKSIKGHKRMPVTKIRKKKGTQEGRARHVKAQGPLSMPSWRKNGGVNRFEKPTGKMSARSVNEKASESKKERRG